MVDESARLIVTVVGIAVEKNITALQATRLVMTQKGMDFEAGGGKSIARIAEELLRTMNQALEPASVGF